jgi:hypothetical protein
MSCGLELIISDTWEEFEAMEEDVLSCNAVHVNIFHSLEEFHAAARELLEAGLSPDDNYYRDPAGKETFSLWYYHESRAPLHGCTPSEKHPGRCAECGEPLVYPK